MSLSLGKSCESTNPTGSRRAFTTISEYLWVTVGRDLSCPRLVEMPLGDLLDDIAQLGRAR